MKTHSSLSGAVALGSLIAFLGGCSGASQMTPAGSAALGAQSLAGALGAQSVSRAATFAVLPAGPNAEHVQYSAQNPPGAVPARFRPLEPIIHAAGVRPEAIAFKQQGLGPKAPALNYIFTSDRVTGNISIYNEANLSLIAQVSGYGGWGVAADKKGHVCWGTFYALIACGNVTATGWTPTAYLNESYGAALGIAFTNNGDLYATNLGTNTIDHWSKAAVSGCSNCNPVSRFTIPQMSVPAYLAADGAKLYVDGDDATFTNVIVGIPNQKNHTFAQIQSQPASGFYAGGMAFDKSHTLIWNNEYGTLYALPSPYTTASSSFQYGNGTDPLFYTAIALDSKQNNVLAANIYVCGSSTCSGVQENSYPLGSFGIASNYVGDLNDYGIAITPPGNN